MDLRQTTVVDQSHRYNFLLEQNHDPTADFIKAIQIRPHFHPIVDVFTGTVLGYELLARGNPPYESPAKMFREAGRLDAGRQLEKACCDAALRSIAALPGAFDSALFFINISPAFFADPGFINEFTRAALREHGIDRARVVIEITEEKSVTDYALFEKLIAHYTHEGFHIALDDFGSGHSGLITLVASTPHFLKLDMAIVRDVHKHDYKQKLVKAITSFASSVNAKLIAEGVECLEELDFLVRFGVRYAQGFLFGRPQPDPPVLDRTWKSLLKGLIAKHDLAAVDLDATIGSLVICPMMIQKNGMSCGELDLVFKRKAHLDHAVVMDEKDLTGLITRQHFYFQTGGAFGYQLLQKKPVGAVCKTDPLIIDEMTTITTLARLAMDRRYEDLYDPVLVTDASGHFKGTVTMKQVMTKSIELEIRSAMGLNPLTGLPGNNVIHRWIHDALSAPEYTIIYVDLDHFKTYNDAYGFLMGDEMLRFTAKILSRWINHLPANARLGHIGGDDFIIVGNALIDESMLANLCLAFDSERRELFKTKDWDRGYIEAADRQGHPARIPLVTMGLAVIDSTKTGFDAHPALFSELAASLKKKVKQKTAETGRSAYLCERRVHGGESADGPGDSAALS